MFYCERFDLSGRPVPQKWNRDPKQRLDKTARIQNVHALGPEHACMSLDELHAMFNPLPALPAPTMTNDEAAVMVSMGHAI